ncbi:hypothetical protein Tco_1316256 [Tanacetum coccineum]
MVPRTVLTSSIITSYAQKQFLVLLRKQGKMLLRPQVGIGDRNINLRPSRRNNVDALGHDKETDPILQIMKKIDGGFVAFGGDPKGGKITGKGKISIDTECVVLSPDFKLLYENHVLLRVSRKDNMYSVDLKNIVPSGGIENLIDLKVKVIRCDNRTEFKNKVMNQFCEMKGYSTNSKAFRVFNTRTRIVEENLHVQFSETTPNIAGSGPNWLFDIDALTKSMNYKPVVAGNQSNGSAGTKACDDAGKARMETIPGKDYILLPLWPQDPQFSSSSKDSYDAGFKPSWEEEKKDVEDPENKDSEVSSTEEPRVNQEEDANINNTNNINTVSPTVNVAGIEDKA